jgi:hypothetical protein
MGYFYYGSLAPSKRRFLAPPELKLRLAELYARCRRTSVGSTIIPSFFSRGSWQSNLSWATQNALRDGTETGESKPQPVCLK